MKVPEIRAPKEAQKENDHAQTENDTRGNAGRYSDPAGGARGERGGPWHLEVPRAKLERMLSQAHDATVQQATATAVKQEATRQLQMLVTEGTRLGNALRGMIKDRGSATVPADLRREIERLVRAWAAYEKCTDALLYEWDRGKFDEGAAIGFLDARAKRTLLMGIARKFMTSILPRSLSGRSLSTSETCCLILDVLPTMRRGSSRRFVTAVVFRSKKAPPSSRFHTSPFKSISARWIMCARRTSRSSPTSIRTRGGMR
jgi:hypothetical protein